MSDAFEEIKFHVTVPDAAAYYGLRANRAGYIKCPFHTERTASLKLYPNRWHCFGCGEGGDVVNFVARLYSLSAIDAARRLDADFKLGLFPDRPLTRRERRQAAESARKRADDKSLVEAFNAWWADAWLTVIWYHWHLKDERERLRPRSMNDEISAEFAAVLHEADKVGYMLDCLMSNDLQERIDFYAGWREKVKQIELFRRSRENTGTL